MLTVIITSYGNRPYLERCIDYWSRSTFSVVVADGSLSPWRGEISSNITYLHLPTPHGANPFSDYARRKLIAIENVKTKYVANCADDDFLAFNGLSRCVNYLESHPEIAATHGWGPWFLHDEFNLRWRFPDFSKNLMNKQHQTPPIQEWQKLLIHLPESSTGYFEHPFFMTHLSCRRI